MSFIWDMKHSVDYSNWSTETYSPGADTCRIFLWLLGDLVLQANIFVSTYSCPAHLGGFEDSRRLGRIPSAERRQSFFNDQFPSWYFHQSRFDFVFSVYRCSYSLVITAAGGWRFSGMRPVRFSYLGMEIGRFLSRVVGLKIALCPWLLLDTSSYHWLVHWYNIYQFHPYSSSSETSAATKHTCSLSSITRSYFISATKMR